MLNFITSNIKKSESETLATSANKTLYFLSALQYTFLKAINNPFYTRKEWVGISKILALVFLFLSHINSFSKVPRNARRWLCSPCCHTAKSGPFSCMVRSRPIVTFSALGTGHGIGTRDVQHSIFNPLC